MFPEHGDQLVCRRPALSELSNRDRHLRRSTHWSVEDDIFPSECCAPSRSYDQGDVHVSQHPRNVFVPDPGLRQGGRSEGISLDPAPTSTNEFRICAAMSFLHHLPS